MPPPIRSSTSSNTRKTEGGRRSLSHRSRPFTLSACSLLLSLAVGSFAVASATGFIIRSALPSNARCNETAASECFFRLYGIKDDGCSQAEMRFRCVDYKYLDDCFKKHAGLCEASVVGQSAAIAYRRSLLECDKKSRKSHREVLRMPFTGGVARMASGEGSHQLISTLGALQTQCTISSHENCSSEHVDEALERCEHTIRFKKFHANHAADFDRHKLLRIKLDTSKKLLHYSETNKERECLSIRSALTEIYQIHHRHCFHVIITRCLCERHTLERLCGIRCESLEARSPDEDFLAWEDFKGALMRSSQVAPPILSALFFKLIVILLVCLFIR